MFLQLLMAATGHPWRLDLVSLAGILAAIGTGVLAFFTSRLAMQTRNLAAETEEDVRAEWRPVLEHKETEVHATGGETYGRVGMVLTNAGRGPAISTQLGMSSESSTQKRTAEPQPFGTIVPGGVVSAEFPAMLYRDSSEGEDTWLKYTVSAEYEDLSGRSHRTTLSFEDDEYGERQVGPHQDTSFFPIFRDTLVSVDPLRQNRKSR